MNFLDPRLPRRFWAQLQPCPMTGCWLWTGKPHRNGYGVAGIKCRLVHRIAFVAANGPIPSGLEIDHRCRVRCCANPAHLEAVTHRTNVLRGDTIAARNAAKTHCPKGHPYDEKNTYPARGGRGRACRRCHADRVQAAARRAS